MIESVKVNRIDREGNKSRVGLLPEILKRDGVFNFKPGLNIIIGANGTGKTSLIKGMASQLAATNFGFTHVDNNWMADYVKNDLIKGSMDIIHDGQVVFYSDTNVSAPVVDTDNMSLSISNAFLMFGASRESTGEHALKRIAPILDMLDVEPYEQLVELPSGLTEAQSHALNEHFKPKIKTSQPTIILDEPELGLGLLSEAHFWQSIKKAAKENKYQIILVSHSSQCLNIENANYIDMAEGYMDACLSVLSGTPLNEAMQELSFSGGISLSNKEKELMLKLAEHPDGVIMKGVSEEQKSLLSQKLIDCDSVPKDYKSMSIFDILDEEQEEVFFLTVKGSQYVKQVIKRK